MRSEEHTSELQSLRHLVCRLHLDLHSFPTRRSSDLGVTRGDGNRSAGGRYARGRRERGSRRSENWTPRALGGQQRIGGQNNNPSGQSTDGKGARRNRST